MLSGNDYGPSPAHWLHDTTTGPEINCSALATPRNPTGVGEKPRESARTAPMLCPSVLTPLRAQTFLATSDPNGLYSTAALSIVVSYDDFICQ